MVPMPISPPDASFRLRQILVPAYGPTVVASVGHGAILPIIALHARSLDATVAQAAALVGLVGLGQLLASLPSGALVARIGERRALIWTGIAETVIFVGAWWTTSLLAFAGLAFVMGGTWTVFLLARQGFIIDAVPSGYRARALSSLGGSYRIGIFVGPFLGAGVIQLWGVPAVFLVGALTSMVAVLLVQSMPDLSVAAREHGDTHGHESVWQVLLAHRRVFATLGTAVGVISASRALRISILPLWCDHIGLSASATSLAFGIAAAVDVSLFYPAGWIMDRFGRRWVAFSVVAGATLGVLLLPLADDFGSVLAVAVVIAIGNGLGSGIVMTLGADTAPELGRAQYLGGWRLCGDLGNSGAPLLLGLLAGAVPLATACLVLGGLGVLGTGWVSWWTREFDQSR
jgi:MFS family permease